MSVSRCTLEFLRAGPAHGQLLSPLTQYLGVIDSNASASITMPFHQQSFNLALKDLRYQTDSYVFAERRRAVLESTGESVADVLAQVPGMTSSLRNGAGQLLHLRVVLSASELAAVPWELSKDPNAPHLTAENWLGHQTRTPTVITRKIRSVTDARIRWDRPPKILFVHSDAGGPVPADEHLERLKASLRPWLFPPDSHGSGRRIEDVLTVLGDHHKADLYAAIVKACAEHDFTHVHVLAHGMLLEDADYESFGVAFHGDDGGLDVVNGARFVRALNQVSESGRRCPTVVTVAGCDSGNVGSLVHTGASFAHALHEGGVPFVVASQFPISTDGSVSFVEDFYGKLLWGENPLWVMHEVRARLFGARSAKDHDWATLVVYEALPDDFDDDIEDFRYRQAKTAMDAALNELDGAVDAAWTASDAKDRARAKEPPAAPATDEPKLTADSSLRERVETACDRLPGDGLYRAESLGLKGSCLKRIAEANYRQLDDSKRRSDTRTDWNECCIEALKDARRQYREAAKAFALYSGELGQKVATLHWLGAQVCSLDVVLGDDWRHHDALLHAARYAAECHLEVAGSDEALAWAHGSLMEIALIEAACASPPRKSASKSSARSTTSGQAAACDTDPESRARQHLRELLRLFPTDVDFPHYSTRRQLGRYVNWWGKEDFIASLRKGASYDKAKAGRLIRLAALADELLSMMGPSVRSAG